MPRKKSVLENASFLVNIVVNENLFEFNGYGKDCKDVFLTEEILIFYEVQFLEDQQNLMIYETRIL